MTDRFGAGAPLPSPPSRGGFLATAIALLVLLLAFAWWAAREGHITDNARAMVRASYAKRIEMSDLLVQLETAESAQRGYVITNVPSFLRHYEPARRDIQIRLARLTDLYRDDPFQAARIHRLEILVDAKFAEMDGVLRVRAAGGLAAGAKEIEDDRGRQLMERTRGVVAAATAREDAMLAANISHTRSRTEVLNYTIWGLLALVAVAMLAALAMRLRSRARHYQLECQAHEALERLRAIFASTAGAMFTLNPSGTIEDINTAALRLLNVRKQDIAGRDVSTVIDLAPGEGTFAERLGIVGDRLAEPYRTDLVANARGGREIPVDVSLGLMPLADGRHVVVSLLDISERKAAERLKDEFISTVSHELRTPLTSVIGSLGLLRGGAAGELPEPARRLVDIAENNSRRLIRLINDILDIDRIGSGRSAMETALVDLRNIAERGLEDARGLAESRGVILASTLPDDAVGVLADSDRMLQVIGNLLSNAIRFTPSGKEVRLHVERQDGRAIACIEDSGPGVAQEFRERIFSRFAQSSAGAAIAGGTGLGLAISREIVKAHDGEIWFEDAPGGGARFCLSLPLHVVPDHEGRDGDTILICEDDPEAAEVLRSMIEQLGYNVMQCGTAREVQSLVQAGDFAGVVLDLRLPDASGLAAVRALRAFPKARALPVIVVSAFAREGERDPSAHALDVIDWIDKPVDPGRLARAIERAIRQSSEGRPTLLHIDDDPDMLEVTALALADKGRMLKATNLAAARAILARITPDIVILDLNLPDGYGLDLLPDLFAADGTAVPTIIYSASEMIPEVGRQFDAVLVKSRRSMFALSQTIGDILEKRGAHRGSG